MRRKFFIAYFLVVSVLCGLISYIYYRTTSDTLYNMVTTDMLTVLQKNNQIIDHELKNIENYANSFVADTTLDEYLAQYQSARSTYDYYRLDRPFTKLLHNYFFSSPSIFSAQMMTEHMSYGDVIGSNIIPVQNFSGSSIYDMAVAGDGKTVWIPTYDFYREYGQSSINSEKDPYRYVFSAAKLIRQSSDDYVVLVLNFLDNVYAQIFQSPFSEYDSNYLIVSADKKIICQSDSVLTNALSKDPSFESVFSAKSGHTLLNLNGDSYIVCYDVSTVTNWMSAYLIRQDMLVNRFAREVFKNLSVILIILILLPLILILYINQRLIRPLDVLHVGIVQSGAGDFKTPLPVQGFDEVRTLIRSFNESNAKIDHLIKENYESQILKKEAELTAYDLQLNPHFILNTLNLINLELMKEENDDLCETVSALSRVIEYTLRTKSLTVPFSTDLSNTRHYLHVLQKRYKEAFTVSYEVDPSLLSSEVPKLFLQPFAENAIRHGFHELSRQGKIIIRAYRADHLRIFEIEDNGSGISPETLAELQNKNSSHIGINNIRYRILYLYGEEYDISIVPLNPGTLIRLYLPAEDLVAET